MRKYFIFFAIVAMGIFVLNSEAYSMGKALKIFHVTGKIKEVNLKALTIKIAPQKGDAVLFRINEKTKLVKGNKSLIPSNLKKDDQVTVYYKIVWGKKVASEVVVQERVVAPQKNTPMKTPVKTKR